MNQTFFKKTIEVKYVKAGPLFFTSCRKNTLTKVDNHLHMYVYMQVYILSCIKFFHVEIYVKIHM
jgi:hypothetical protein